MPIPAESASRSGVGTVAGVPARVATLRCESCGAEQETNLLGDSDPVCENCGSRTLTQVEDETASPTPDASASETRGGAAAEDGGQTGGGQAAAGQTVAGQTVAHRTTDPEEVPFSPGALFEILADDRQRYVLYYLLEEDGRETLADVVDRLAAWRNEATVDALEADARENVSVGLYHAALPKLDDAGLVDFDPERETVVATDELHRITPFLDLARAAEPEDYERFLDLLDARSPSGER